MSSQEVFHNIPIAIARHSKGEKELKFHSHGREMRGTLAVRKLTAYLLIYKQK
jgi:hypothetical protein